MSDEKTVVSGERHEKVRSPIDKLKDFINMCDQCDAEPADICDKCVSSLRERLARAEALIEIWRSDAQNMSTLGAVVRRNNANDLEQAL